MALSDPLIYHSTDNAAVFTREVWERLTGVSGGSHLDWEVIEAWDGTTRAAPSGGTTVDHLPAGHLWRSDAGSDLPENAWIVGRAQAGAVSAQCALFVQLIAVTKNPQWYLIPYDDWSVGAGTDTNPTKPATAIGGNTTPNTRLDNVAGHRRVLIADESSIRILQTIDPASTLAATWLYAGEIDTFHDEADDPRPFVIIETTANVYLPAATTALVRRISPVDDSTVIQLYPIENDAVLDDIGAQSALGKECLMPVTVFSKTASHAFISGQLRYVTCIGEAVHSEPAGGTAGTCGPAGALRKYISRSSSNSFPPLTLPWDGSTAFGNEELTLARVPTSMLYPSERGTGHTLVRQRPYLVRSRP